MAVKKGSQTAKVGAPKKGKQATQKRTPQQRIMVLGPTGKKRFEWRDWA